MGQVVYCPPSKSGSRREEVQLLARNLLSHFSNMGKTIESFRANVAKN